MCSGFSNGPRNATAKKGLLADNLFNRWLGHSEAQWVREQAYVPPWLHAICSKLLAAEPLPNQFIVSFLLYRYDRLDKPETNV
jgi:hypothetical protein